MRAYIRKAEYPDKCGVCGSGNDITRIKFLDQNIKHVLSLCSECYNALEESMNGN